jgi:hypothetical protein
MNHRSLALLMAAALSLPPGTCLAQEKPAAGTAAPEPLPEPLTAPDSPGTRRALIICGLPGDADHRKLFAESLELLYAGLVKQHGFAAANLHLLWGDKPTEKDGDGVRASRTVASRETIAAAAGTLRKALKPEDTLWVFVLGHAHYDGRYSWLNVEGNDIQQLEFGRLFEGLRCREQVFFMTTAASGFYSKPLAAPGRIVITATEPDLEVNETLFPHRLARAIGSPPHAAELDRDGDGRHTLLDLYLLTARDTAQEYATGQLLATEHSLIDDNGDGRGTEVQMDYLPEELGGRRRPGRPTTPTNLKGDGALAQRTVLPFLQLPPAPKPEEKKTEEKKDDAKQDDAKQTANSEG